MQRAASLAAVLIVATICVSAEQKPSRVESCFLLYQPGVGEIVRSPSEACRIRITPASTFKVPHALAALDADVVTPTEVLRFDGKAESDWPASWRKDQTLASAMRHSVVWYFQRIAERLGAEREQQYLKRFAFGNMDPTSALTRFWIGGSLLVSPEEQLAFWVRFYDNKLPISASAVTAVKEVLVQPRGVVNAAGEHPFDAPWPDEVIVSAKTGSATDRSGRAARWLIGHISKPGRQFIFVSCVIGPRRVGSNAAIDLAARSLRQAHVL